MDNEPFCLLAHFIHFHHGMINFLYGFYFYKNFYYFIFYLKMISIYYVSVKFDEN